MSRIEPDSETPSDDSHRVLLLLEPGRDRELFADRLDGHEVVIGTPDEPLPAFDLCLVDMSTYPSVRTELAERKATEPTYMPVLLVVGPDVREAAVRAAAEAADDVLTLPTSGVVFRNRVGSLLRARRQSLALDAQRERFRSVTESAPNPILTIDADGVIQYANPAVEEVFGHEPSAVVGEPLTMLMPERFRAPHEAALERYVETGEKQLEWTAIRFQGRHADGHEVPLLVSFAEYQVDGDRRITGIIQDVTEQVQRQEELERTVDLLDKTGDIADVGGWENDFDTGETVWTDQVYEILDLPPEYEPELDEIIEFYHPEDRAAVAAAGERALETGEPYELEVRLATPDDRQRWVRLRGERAGPGLLRGTLQDITDRKERERELERYETVLETVPEGAWILDRDLRITFANGRVAEGLDMPTDDIIGQPLEAFADTMFPDRETFEGYVDTVEELLAGKRAMADETFVTETAGGPVVNEFRLVPIEHDGAIEGVIGLSRNVTERVDRERELERTVDMLDRAESIADVGGWQYDPANDELLWTDQVYRIHELDPDYEPDVEEAIEFYHPDDRPVLREAVERAIEAGEPYDLELRIVRPDGDERWVRTIGEVGVVDGGRVLRGAIQDIHDRKERERELERTVEQLRQTRDIADVSGWAYDPETGDLYWDEKVRDIYDQLPSFEPTEESVMALYTPESRARMQAAMREAVVEFERFDVEVELDTEPARWVRVTGAPVVEDGRTTAVRGVTRDISQQKRREAFLRRYERIVETSSEPIYTLDRELQFTLVNGALADLVDREPEALLGEHVATLLGDAHAAALAEAAIELDEDRDETTIETTVGDGTGSERRYQTIVSRKPGTEGFVCVSHDITDLTEHQRRISVLDRVLRHNLRNKMNLVLAQTEAIRDRTDEAAVADAVAGIESASEELLSLGEGARRFKTAVDPGATELVAPRNVAEHAAHVVEEARLSYDEATIEADLPDEAWGRAHQELELALSELVDNATTHAGPGATVSVTVTEADDEVVVRVADDGPGIPDLEREAISAGSESPLQHATGLGLWFVRWTVTNSGGSMTIEDREGGGAVVELRLPAAVPLEE